jgi:hypothetical protein
MVGHVIDLDAAFPQQLLHIAVRQPVARKYTFDIALTADDADSSRWQLEFTYEPKDISAPTDLVSQLQDVRLAER